MPDAFLLSDKNLLKWIDGLTGKYDVFGPVITKRGQTVFQKIENPRELQLDYCSTMKSPRSFIYPPRQRMFTIDRATGGYETDVPQLEREPLIFAVHPCDMHAISVLDRTFLTGFRDFYYNKLRTDTFTVVLNCNKSCGQGFCVSMGTGPFLQLENGFDIALTSLQDTYLLEFGSQRGKELAAEADGIEKAGKDDLAEKNRIEDEAKKSFSKFLDTTDLPEILLRNFEHPVYKRTADARCLGCTNCTMVCPTCYCYNIDDQTGYDLKTTIRSRQWDSCQELNFARVHEGNFRASREARLRKFVTHKLATWIEQYGCFGCIGCGRCMTWCPTGIDLTEMAKEIQEDFRKGKTE